jgi:outer membrane receptor protein involved in Fe transport
VLADFVLPQSIFFVGTSYFGYQPNLNLKPEKSFGFDIGTDMRLKRDTVLSFDVYRTNLYGQFFSSVTLAGTHNGLPLYISQTGNLSQSRYEGINLDLRHDASRGIYWHAAMGLTRAYVVSVPVGFYNSLFCNNCNNTYIVPGINFDGQFQSTVPYANGGATIGYRWTPGKYIDISPTYYGNNNPFFEPAFLEFDAHAGYPLTKNVSLNATFRNITGIYGQSYQFLSPTLGAPNITASGLPPYPLYGLPIGPRSVIVTASFRY